MGWMLEAMAIEMPEVAGHPNRVGFRGVLTIVDVVSDRPPAGARGRRPPSIRLGVFISQISRARRSQR
jgi:hypothetical protein